MTNSLWLDPFYLENFGLIAAFLVLIGIPLFLFKDKKTQMQASWASVKSWLYTLPFIYFFIGLPEPGPFIFMCLVSIYSAKTFFQMVGIYHRNWFISLAYFGIALCGVAIYNEHDLLFFSAPFLFLTSLIFVPIFRNDAKNMVQYLSLTLICFCLFGWNLIFAGKIFELENGLYTLLYLYVLSEFSGNFSNAMSLLIPSPQVLPKLTTRTRWSGFTLSFLFTMVIAWAFRRLLFDTSDFYWMSAGFIAFIGSHLGEWTISILRRDLGIKDQGVFIIGRGDLLSRTNRVIYVYPLYTLILLLIGKLSLNIG